MATTKQTATAPAQRQEVAEADLPGHSKIGRDEPAGQLGVR